MNTIGIDIGSSTIKIVEKNDKDEILNKLKLEKCDLKQAIDEFIKTSKINIENIKKIVLTGTGKDSLNEDIYGIPIIKINELEAIGVGGLLLSKQNEALVISMGTGTAFVQATPNDCKHIGGTGVGGGTLFNLCKRFTCIIDFKDIEKAIELGSLKNIDLTMQDISNEEISTLPKDITTSNFGKLNELANENDIILGIANMVFETIGMMAVFATKQTESRNIVVIGSLTKIPYLRKVLDKIEILHNVKFIIPKDAEFGAVLGAIKIAK